VAAPSVEVTARDDVDHAADCIEPCIVDPPASRISTRSTIASGIVDRSTLLSAAGPPVTVRRPLINTSVRRAPSA